MIAAPSAPRLAIPRRGWPALGTTIALACSTASMAMATPARPQDAGTIEVRTVARAASPIEVDAVLDEPAWDSASVLPIAFEWQPGDNTPAVEPAECLVAIDDHALYVAFRVRDSNPAAIRARFADRDTPTDDDTVGIMLDTFADRRRAYQFRVNPLGVQMDAINNDVDRTENWAWDGIWDSAGRITSDGYIVEMAIPFSTLRYATGTGPQTWGLMASRELPRAVRHRMRSIRTDRTRTCLVCQFEPLAGFDQRGAGLDLEFVPTVTAARTDRRGPPAAGRPGPGAFLNGDIEPQAGLSARWSLTPNLTLAGTVNPDFYQVEADAAQLETNTRFRLSFPEKRPFFLEGADFFNTPVQAVFTRTVVDPDWGVKVSGKQNGHAYGAFVTRDAVNTLTFPANEESDDVTLAEDVLTAVARYRRDVGGTSAIGVLVTGREGERYHNRVAGLDGAIRLTDADAIRFQVLGSTTQYAPHVATAFGQEMGAFGGHAVEAFYEHETGTWDWWAGYAEASPGFRVDAGFEPRVDLRRVAGEIERNVYGAPGQWFSGLEFGASFERVEDFDGELTDFEMDFPIEYVAPKWQLSLGYNPSPNRERYKGRTYDNFRHNFDVSLRPSGAFGASFEATVGETIDVANRRQARLLELAPSVELNLWRKVDVNVSHSYERLRVGGGTVVAANLTQARLLYHHSLRAFVRAILQHTGVSRDPALYLDPVDRRSNRLFGQFLFSYKLNPQTVFLVGYSDNYTATDRYDLRQVDRTFFMKIGYAWVL
ncbi:MAG: carbohydrate binding family 9 domain-containing protein [Vicinamibacteraceae bacterium]|nr:carbohydrate binding family 9 domain-containing protein [Vicinamibacteraceae bacterium]